MVAVNTNPEQAKDLPGWREKGQYTFPVVLAPTSDFARIAYDVPGTPTNLLLNADGKLVLRTLGYRSGAEKMMEVQIRELLRLDPFEGVSFAEDKGKRKEARR